MPFKSIKQKQFLYINKPEIAKKFAEDTPKIKKLPKEIKKKTMKKNKKK